MSLLRVLAAVGLRHSECEVVCVYVMRVLLDYKLSFCTWSQRSPRLDSKPGRRSDSLEGLGAIQ